jgi:acyl-CoA synthetase (AMP-forming)/AMP-acid ligase II
MVVSFSPCSVLDLLANAADKDAGISAVTYNEEDGAGASRLERHSYKELLQTSKQLGSHLARQNFPAEQPVLIFSSNHWIAYVAWWACQWAGLIPCPLPLPHPDPSRQGAVVEHLDLLLDHPPLLSTKEEAGLVGVKGSPVFHIDILLEGLSQQPEAPAAAYHQDGSRTATLMLTSGSTAMPKVRPF